MDIKAAVVRGKSGPFVIEDIQLDEPRADEVIVRVVSVGSGTGRMTIVLSKGIYAVGESMLLKPQNRIKYPGASA
jgi:hypothetical protein